MLNRLDRYLLREVTWTFVAVTGVLLIVLLSNQFARVLGQAAANGFPADIVLPLIGLTTLQQLTVLLPIGLFLGIVLALGRLYHESEMTAMTACGVGPLRIYRPIALLAMVIVVLLAVLLLPATADVPVHAQPGAAGSPRRSACIAAPAARSAARSVGRSRRATSSSGRLATCSPARPGRVPR